MTYNANVATKDDTEEWVNRSYLVATRWASLVGLALFFQTAAAQDIVNTDHLRGAQGCADAKARVWAQRPVNNTHLRSSGTSDIDITYYSLDIEIDFTARTVGGVVRVEGRVVNAPISELVLDLGDGMTVTDVSSGSAPLVFTHANRELTITLPSTFSPGAMVSVDIMYGGKPVVTGFGSFMFGTRIGDPFAWSLSEPYGAREWWPCKDHPSDKADSVRVVVTVPDSLTVGSQGLLRSKTVAAGKATYEWVSHYPITTYLISVAVGKFRFYGDTYNRPAALASEFGPLSMPLEHYVYDDGDSPMPSGWARVGLALAVLEDWFGPYPFAAEKYGHANVTFGGGMEHQTLTSMGTYSTGVTVHEAAHQWFGDAVSVASWRHLWLSEGFASYAENLYWEAYPDSFPGGLESSLTGQRNFARYAEGTLALAETLSVGNMFDYTRVYTKGAMVLHMLRNIVGDDDFRTIMRTYAADPNTRYGLATTDVFRCVVENVTGSSFDTFFSQWVTDGTGYPEYRVSADTAPDGSKWSVDVVLEQTQTMPASNVIAFDMPVTFAIETMSGEERFTVQNDQSWQTYRFEVGDVPTRVTFDPDIAILRGADDVVASVSATPKVPVFDGIVPNPTNGTATLRFRNARSGDVTFTLFDAAGRRVAVYPRGNLPTGPMEFSFGTDRLANGVYFVRMETSTGSSTRKMVVVR